MHAKYRVDSYTLIVIDLCRVDPKSADCPSYTYCHFNSSLPYAYYCLCNSGYTTTRKDPIRANVDQCEPISTRVESETITVTTGNPSSSSVFLIITVIGSIVVGLVFMCLLVLGVLCVYARRRPEQPDHLAAHNPDQGSVYDQLDPPHPDQHEVFDAPADPDPAIQIQLPDPGQVHAPQREPPPIFEAPPHYPGPAVPLIPEQAHQDLQEVHLQRGSEQLSGPPPPYSEHPEGAP